MIFEHLISRPAIATSCRRCHAPVLAAITGGLTTTCDIENLNVNAEIAALLTGRGTYDMIRCGTRGFYVEPRFIHRMRGHRNYPVLADHRCPDGKRGQPARTPLTAPKYGQPAKRQSKSRPEPELTAPPF